ncbi:hypothetical protein ElyMa_004766000 [Elysia marginata]|uniref:Uncharacterized protein n=1 Tax=Elysia marginata TaxID=1093978 RepID=A0AAV4IJ24_9GAST|nr:hypothetical protein ElyMa_004766000 [Elysia marginata]
MCLFIFPQRKNSSLSSSKSGQEGILCMECPSIASGDSEDQTKPANTASWSPTSETCYQTAQKSQLPNGVSGCERPKIVFSITETQTKQKFGCFAPNKTNPLQA